MYDNNINFKEASILWMSNKIATGNGSYKYICGATCKTGRKCKNKPLKQYKRCHIHFKVVSQLQTFAPINSNDN